MKLKRILPAVVTCAATSVPALSLGLLALFAARISASFGHGVGWSGFLFAAGYIPYIVVSLFAGRMVSAAGRHFSVSLALGLCAVSAAILSYAERFWLVCLCLALFGSAAVFLLPAGAEAVSALTGRTLADCLPLFAPILGGCSALGALIGGLLSAHGQDWRTAVLVLSAATAAAAVLHVLIPFPRLAAIRSDRWQAEFSSALGLQRMYRYYFAAFLYGGMEVLSTVWIVVYMSHTLGYTALIVSFAAVLIWGCACVGRILCAHLSDRLSPQSLAVILCFLLLCALTLCTVIADGRLFWFAVCCIGIGLSGLWQMLFMDGLDVNAGTGATLSAQLLWYCAGAGGFSLFAGAMGSWFSMRGAMAAAIVLAGAELVLLSGVLSRSPRPKAAPVEPVELSAFDELDEELPALTDTASFPTADEFADLDEYGSLDDYEILDDYEVLDEYEELDGFPVLRDYEASAEYADLRQYADRKRLTDDYPDSAEFSDLAAVEPYPEELPDAIYEDRGEYEDIPAAYAEPSPAPVEMEEYEPADYEPEEPLPIDETFPEE